MQPNLYEMSSVKKNIKSGNVKKVVPKVSGVARFTKAFRAKTGNAKINKKIMEDYRKLISEKKLEYTKLAFQPAADRIYVWVEIEKDDLKEKGMFYLAEAEVNARYSQTSACLDAMVVNKRHGLAVPDMYSYYIEIRK